MYGLESECLGSNLCLTVHTSCVFPEQVSQLLWAHFPPL